MDWQDAEWQDFWTEWRRWLAWESEWRAVEQQQAEQLGLLPAMPVKPAQLAQAAGLTEGAGLEAADWRLLLGGWRAEAFGRQEFVGRSREARRSALSRQSSKRLAGLTGPAVFDKAAAYTAAEPLAAYLAAGRETGGLAGQTIAQPLEKTNKIRNWRPEPQSRAGKRTTERAEAAGAVGETLTAEQEAAAEQEPAAVGQKPLRVNLRSRLADKVDKPEIAEIAWPEMPKMPDLAEVQSVEIAEAYKTAEMAAGDNRLPEWPEAELPGAGGALSLTVRESENEAQNLARRPEKPRKAGEAGRADLFAPQGGVDVGAVAEAVAGILCAEIEAQLGSVSFV